MRPPSPLAPPAALPPDLSNYADQLRAAAISSLQQLYPQASPMELSDLLSKLAARIAQPVEIPRKQSVISIAPLPAYAAPVALENVDPGSIHAAGWTLPNDAPMAPLDMSQMIGHRQGAIAPSQTQRLTPQQVQSL